MKPIRGPRAAWTTCGHVLTTYLALGIALACLGLGTAAIWTPSLARQLTLTAVVMGVPALIAAGFAAGMHNTARPRCRRDTLTIPLPWREAVEDDPEVTR